MPRSPGRPKIVRGMDVTEKLARLRAHDPNRGEDSGDVKLEGNEAMRVKVRPFMATADETGEYATVTIRLPYDLFRQVDKILTEGRAGSIPLPYRHQSDFARDAYYKWFEFITEKFNADDVSLSVFLKTKQDVMAMAEEYGQNLEVQKSLQLFLRLLPSYIESRRPDVLHKELARWHKLLKQYEEYDDYWAGQWKGELLSNPYVKAALNIIFGSVEYKDTEVARDMGRWLGELTAVRA